MDEELLANSTYMPEDVTNLLNRARRPTMPNELIRQFFSPEGTNVSDTKAKQAARHNLALQYHQQRQRLTEQKQIGDIRAQLEELKLKQQAQAAALSQEANSSITAADQAWQAALRQADPHHSAVDIYRHLGQSLSKATGTLLGKISGPAASSSEVAAASPHQPPANFEQSQQQQALG